jgi:hypothetical protein
MQMKLQLQVLLWFQGGRPGMCCQNRSPLCQKFPAVAKSENKGNLVIANPWSTSTENVSQCTTQQWWLTLASVPSDVPDNTIVYDSVGWLKTNKQMNTM